MADHHGAVTTSVGMDYAEHERTYRMFLSLLKRGSITVVVILVGMAYFLI